MNRFPLLALLGVVLAMPMLVFFTNTLPAQEKGAPPNPTKWEYKIVYELRPEKDRSVPISEKELNELGAEGWELCGVVNKTRGSISGGGTLGVRGETSTQVYFLFKRPKR